LGSYFKILTNDVSVLQIVSVQTLHYLTLSILIPPLLNLFAEPNSLSYEGGAANVGMWQDFREYLFLTYELLEAW